MAIRPPLDLGRLLADAQRRRLQPVDGPNGVQWFVDIRFADPEWFRDRARVRALVSGLAAASWFREFQVFARDHQPGSSFASLDEVTDLVACGEPGNAIFARGEPRMTVDIDEAEAALSIDINVERLELRLWLGRAVTERHGSAVLDDMIAFVVAWRESVPGSLVANALALPRPADGLRYRRTRPLRIGNRALDAVVDIVDRTAPREGPLWGPDSHAMANAVVPADGTRVERGSLVMIRWVENPADLVALADGCARHERWIVPLVGTRIAPGWNAAGDLHVPIQPSNRSPAPFVAFDSDSHHGYVELADGVRDEDGWASLRTLASLKSVSAGRVAGVSLIAASRSEACAIAERARSAGFTRVLYRDPSAQYWDPFPPGLWL
jgi:hypothetical protein